MGRARYRELLPWERRCGCPTCGVKPRERCVTLSARYLVGGRPGAATAPHKARVDLWRALFGGRGA